MTQKLVEEGGYDRLILLGSYGSDLPDPVLRCPEAFLPTAWHHVLRVLGLSLAPSTALGLGVSPAEELTEQQFAEHRWQLGVRVGA